MAEIVSGGRQRLHGRECNRLGPVRVSYGSRQEQSGEAARPLWSESKVIRQFISPKRIRLAPEIRAPSRKRTVLRAGWLCAQPHASALP